MNVTKSAPERLRQSIRKNRERRMLGRAIAQINREWLGEDWRPGMHLTVKLPKNWESLASSIELSTSENTCAAGEPNEPQS